MYESSATLFKYLKVMLFRQLYLYNLIMEIKWRLLKNLLYSSFRRDFHLIFTKTENVSNVTYMRGNVITNLKLSLSFGKKLVTTKNLHWCDFGRDYVQFA